MTVETVSAGDRNSLYLAGLFVALIVLLLVFQADASSVSVFGVSLPVLCPFRLLTGLNCPGCGLTRSMVLAFHGDFGGSFHLHGLGIPFAALLAAQIPYRLALYKLGVNTMIPDRYRGWADTVLLSALIIPWTVRLILSLI